MSLEFKRELEYMMLGKIKPTKELLAVALKKIYDEVEYLSETVEELSKKIRN